MSRRRLQMKGSLYREGGWWRLRWREDAVDAGGSPHRVRRSGIIGPCKGAEALTERQAKKKAWDDILCHVNATASCPQSLMTLRQFVAQKFEPEHVWSLKHAGQEHYKYCLSKILPALGDVPLRDIHVDSIQRLVRAMVSSGLSVQTAVHVRTALHAIFQHAKRVGHFSGDNPASLVRLPEMIRKRIQALSFEQAAKALDAMPSPVREMVYLSMTTSPNVAELCGLRWRRLNLSGEFMQCDGTVLSPRSMLIEENWYRNRPGTVKTAKRRRIVPLPAEAIPMLVAWRVESKFTGQDDYVFSSRTGKPIDAHNTNSRLFKRVGELTGAKVTWHIFRHSCATFAEQVGMARSDRIALMGHSRGEITDNYTHADIERMRGTVDRIAGELSRAKGKAGDAIPVSPATSIIQ